MNNFRRFKNLTTSNVRTVATIISHNADGTSTVELMNGASITVLGQSVAVGFKAYVESGRVIGQAADLTYMEVEI